MRLKRGAHSAWALTNMPPATPKLGILMWPPTGSRCAVIICRAAMKKEYVEYDLSQFTRTILWSLHFT